MASSGYGYGAPRKAARRMPGRAGICQLFTCALPLCFINKHVNTALATPEIKAGVRGGGGGRGDL